MTSARLLACFACAFVSLAAQAPARITRLNSGWTFLRLAKPEAGSKPAEAGPDLDDSAWERVRLPHTARLESPAAANRHWQGICWYRLRLEPRAQWKQRRVALRFDGAMQRAEVFVNGELRLTHEGGYLPFTLDLSRDVAQGRRLSIALRLDNRDMPDLPPGKPLHDLDFTYAGGLYRNVWLEVTDGLHITDAVEAEKVGSGGVYVRCDEARPDRARLIVQTHLRNDGRPARAALRHTLLDPKGRPVATATETAADLPVGGERTGHQELNIARPSLWHPDHPWLYTLRTEVLVKGHPVDRVETKVGLRSLESTIQGGLLLNGEPFTPRGANRHNDYPWIGNAISDEAQERDARKLKAAGFNFLRLAHYPQSPAFLDACDRLGLMVAVCVPGWQWFQDTPAFKARVERDVRHMVRRDRNHPCLLYWETSLNETYRPNDAFYRRLIQIAHEEMPGGCLTGGDTLGRKDAAFIGYDLPYTLWTDFYDRPMAKELAGRKGFHREYGDYEFGGESSTSRMARGDGETAQLLQAWNYVWSHNRNLAMPWTLGDAIWVGIDHFRGCSKDQAISRCGSLDYLRLPKYVYHFYASQRDPDLLRSDVESGPMAFLATEWTPRTGAGSVVVFSNGDEVELFLNGRSLGRRGPDAGPDSPYQVPIPDADPNYWQKGEVTRQDAMRGGRSIPAGVAGLIFDGGNASHVAHPPFTFPKVSFEAGELKAVAYRQGKTVATHLRHTPGAPTALALWADESTVPLRGDGADVVFLRAELRDAQGHAVPSNGALIRFTVSAPGELVGPDTAPAEAGIASILLRAKRPGAITVSATSPGLRPATFSLIAHAPREQRP